MIWRDGTFTVRKPFKVANMAGVMHIRDFGTDNHAVDVIFDGTVHLSGSRMWEATVGETYEFCSTPSDVNYIFIRKDGQNVHFEDLIRLKESGHIDLTVVEH